MSEKFTVAEYIQEELDARGWTLHDLVIRMCLYDYGVHKLSLDMLFAVAEDDALSRDCFIGPEMDEALCRAFGVSEGLFTRLEAGCKERNAQMRTR